MAYYVYGTNYSETIYGTNYSESIYGYGGHDAIYAYGGHDYLNGGSGNDRLYGGSGNDDLVGGTGYNDYWGGSGYDWFIMSGRGSAGFSDDVIHDFTFDVDKVDVSAWGVSDFGQIEALLGRDSTGSATLNAYYYGYDHRLTIDGVAPSELVSSDFVYSNSGAQTVNGTSRADVLFGSRYGDVINGNGGADILLGGLGNDSLRGGTGNDDLIGGLGKDTLRGDSGYDIFAFLTPSETPNGSGRDRILDFDRRYDLIDVEEIDANTFFSGDQDFEFIGKSSFDAAGQIRYANSGGNTIISGNTDNDSTPEFQIELAGTYTLSESDFLL